MPDPLPDGLLTRERLSGARLPLERATTLPAVAFRSPAVYEREVDRLFAREWLCAGRADEVPEPGDYFTLDLLGDKLVVVRGTDGEIRVLSRVCRHRAAEVAQGAGNARSFQCPYHSWTYRLDGGLVGAPYMDDVEGFEREDCRLPELRSELWEGWIFVNFDRGAEALGPRLAPLSARLAPYRMSEMIAVETAVFDSPFNWKVLVDNFMEAYHHIAIHRDTLEPIFPGALSHAPDNDGPYSVLIMPRGAGAEGHPLVAAVTYPLHLFAPGDGMLTWYQILPQRSDRFTLRIYSCFPREVLDDPRQRESVAGLQAFVERVHRQDIEACEATWSGLAARSFEAGRLSSLEKPIWQFNQWWIERMADGA